MAGNDEWWLFGDSGGLDYGDYGADSSAGYASGNNPDDWSYDVGADYSLTQPTGATYDFGSGWNSGGYDASAQSAGLPSQPDYGGFDLGGYGEFSGGFDYGAGSGAGAPAPSGGDVGNGISFTQGSGANGGLTPNAGGGMGFKVDAPTTDSSISGGFGTGGREQFLREQAGGRTRSMLGNNAAGGNTFSPRSAGFAPQSARTPAADALAKFSAGAKETQTSAMDWARNNASTARLGLDALGMLVSAGARNQANKLGQQQLDMQRQAQQKNAAVADRMNAEAAQSLSEARSLYNPQQFAIQSMANQKIADARRAADARTQMQRSGKNKATIDAEMRRANLGSSLGANTAYMQGLSTGRQAQQQALQGAKGLSSTYNTAADYSGADRVAAGGAADAQNLQAMLNNYLGNPIYQSDAEAFRRARKAAYYD